MLEYEFKWAFGSISVNQASGGDGIPVLKCIFVYIIMKYVYIIYLTVKLGHLISSSLALGLRFTTLDLLLLWPSDLN